MKYRIHGTWPDGTEDSFDIEADSVEDARAMIQESVLARNWSNCWSEEVE